MIIQPHDIDAITVPPLLPLPHLIPISGSVQNLEAPNPKITPKAG